MGTGGDKEGPPTLWNTVPLPSKGVLISPSVRARHKSMVHMEQRNIGFKITMVIVFYLNGFYYSLFSSGDHEKPDM